MSGSRDGGGLVWSSEHGRMCPRCAQPVDRCRCKGGGNATSAPAKDGVVRIARETKGRKGKGVTLVQGLPLAADALKTLAKELKQMCGSGGTLRDGVVEIQGDHRDRLAKALSAKGYTVKKVGG